MTFFLIVILVFLSGATVTLCSACLMYSSADAFEIKWQIKT